MPVERRIDPEHGFVRAVWTGEIRLPQLTEGIRRLFTEPSLVKIGRSLADVRLADLAVSMEEITSSHLGLLAPSLGSRRWRIAMLVRTELQYGICRQFVALTDSHVDGAVFQNEHDALEWLQRDT